MEDSSGLNRFGEIVAARRARLGLTRLEVRDAGGPSDTTLGSIENGTLGRAPGPSTLRKLDRSLRWVGGSAADVLAGGEPTAVESRRVDAGVRPSGSFTAGPDAISLPLSEINSLLELHRNLNTEYDRCSERGGSHPGIDVVARDFNAFVSRVAGRYATVVLERNGGPGVELPPVVEMAFSHLLDLPALADDLVEKEEQLYRRWLAGRLDGIDVELQVRFEERWSERDHGS